MSSYLDLRETFWCIEEYGVLGSDKLGFRYCVILTSCQTMPNKLLLCKTEVSSFLQGLCDIKDSIKKESSCKVLVHSRCLINIHFFLPHLFLLLSFFMLLDNENFILTFGFCFYVCPKPDCIPSPPVLAFSDAGGRDNLFDFSIVQPLADLALPFANLNLKCRMFPRNSKDLEKL